MSRPDEIRRIVNGSDWTGHYVTLSTLAGLFNFQKKASVSLEAMRPLQMEVKPLSLTDCLGSLFLSGAVRPRPRQQKVDHGAKGRR